MLLEVEQEIVERMGNERRPIGSAQQERPAPVAGVDRVVEIDRPRRGRSGQSSEIRGDKIRERRRSAVDLHPLAQHREVQPDLGRARGLELAIGRFHRHLPVTDRPFGA
jgi:hypothetical protein